MGGTYRVESECIQFLQGCLCRHTVFPDDIRIITADFLFQVIQIDLVIENTTVQGSESSEHIPAEYDILAR